MSWLSCTHKRKNSLWLKPLMLRIKRGHRSTYVFAQSHEAPDLIDSAIIMLALLVRIWFGLKIITSGQWNCIKEGLHQRLLRIRLESM